MAKLKKSGPEVDVPVVADNEDKQTLAAIDEGIRDAQADRTVPSDAVRELVPQWITASGTRKKR
jgi:predicted transcriptional regulator